ncbi:MAG: hypothetical protein K2X64_05510 [Rhodocyclaceae bacterium]|nr:hypothetical protein [Rhodocyclaceae bacterium]
MSQQKHLFDLEGLRAAILAPREIVRGPNGELTHYSIPVCDEDVRYDLLLGAFGIETAFVSMESDNAELADNYSENGDGDFSSWNPTPPEGTGWMLLEMYDTEDSPYALFGRERPYAEQCRLELKPRPDRRYIERDTCMSEMVERFLAWPLPGNVCADPCATQTNAPHRSGTNLLDATQARAMLEHVLQLAPATFPDPL